MISRTSRLDGYPRGPGSDLLKELMSESMELFAELPSICATGGPQAAGHQRMALGAREHAAIDALRRAIRQAGAMITAVDLLRGLATLLGWRRIEVPGATGYLDTDYAAKGRYAVEALKDVDLVCVHVEATDEASHEGNAAAKVEALEQIDRQLSARSMKR